MKRYLSLLLVLAMLFGMTGVSALSEEELILEEELLLEEEPGTEAATEAGTEVEVRAADEALTVTVTAEGSVLHASASEAGAAIYWQSLADAALTGDAREAAWADIGEGAELTVTADGATLYRAVALCADEIAVSNEVCPKAAAEATEETAEATEAAAEATEAAAEATEETAEATEETAEATEETAEATEETAEATEETAEATEETAEATEETAEATEETAEVLTAGPECVVKSLDDITEECQHLKRYSSGATVYILTDTATDNGNGTHTGTADQYDIDICPDCGRNLYVLIAENVQATLGHHFNDGVCEDCYAQNTCKHEDRTFYANKSESKDVTDNKDGTHTLTTREGVLYDCPTCDDTFTEWGNWSEPVTEYHEWSLKGSCRICDATNACEHPNKTETESYEAYTAIEINGDCHQEYGVSFTLVECPDCGLKVRTDEQEYNEERAHSYQDGSCICGATPPCEHVNAIPDYKDQWGDFSDPIDNEDGTHTLTYQPMSSGYCNDCGADGLEVPTGEPEPMIEAHVIGNDDLCTVCGGTSPCEHVNAIPDYKEQWGDFSDPIDNRDGTHTQTYQKMSSGYCKDCGADGLEVPVGKSETLTETHVIGNDDLCSVCGAKKTCKHTNTRVDSHYEDDRSEPASQTKKTHSLNRTEYIDTYCVDCNWLLEKKTEPAGLTVEPHSYDADGICSVCGIDSSKQCMHENVVLTYRYEILAFKWVKIDNKAHRLMCAIYGDKYCTDCGYVIQADEALGICSVDKAHRVDKWGTCEVCDEYIDQEHLNRAAREDRTVDAVLERGESTHKIRYSIGKQDICTDCGAEIDGLYDVTTVEKTEAHDFSNGICRACGAENSCAHSRKATEERNDQIPAGFDSEHHTQFVQPISVTYCPDCGEVLQSEPTGEGTEVESTHQFVTKGGLQYCEGCEYFRVVCTRHTYALVKAKAATCTEDGYKAYYACSVCETPKTTPVVIPAKGHTAKVIPAKAKTCTEDGYSEHKICSVCNECLGEPVIDTATGHQEVTDPTVEGTCVTIGLTEGSHCEVCGETIVAQQELGYGDHKFEDSECVYCGRIADIEDIYLYEESIDLGVKDTYQIEVDVLPVKAAGQVVYSSSDATVAKVDANGLVTALKAGEAKIYVKGGEKEATLYVNVQAGISKLVLDRSTVQMEPGEEHDERLRVEVTGYSANKLQWSSSNTSVVEIAGIDGTEAKLIGRKAGTATIKVQASNGRSATCRVTVVDPTKLAGVELTCSAGTFPVGADTVFRARTMPSFSEESDVTVSFKSSNPKVMTVNESSGSAQALAAGTAVITVTATQGRIKKTATMKVTVYDPKKVQSVSVEDIAAKETLLVGNTYSQYVNCVPEQADVVLSAVSSNPSVVEAWIADDMLHLATYVGKTGTARVTVTAVDATGGRKTFVSNITVKDPYEPTALELEAQPVVTLIDEEVYVTAKVKGLDGYMDLSNYTVSYTSSNPRVATVDSQGNLTLLKTGKVTITATVTYGKVKKTARATIQIVDPDTLYSVVANDTSIEGHVGGRVQVRCMIFPWTIDIGTLQFSLTSSNKKLATVDEMGNVELLGAGTVTITVTVTQGKVKKTAKVTVKIVK